MVLFFWLPLFGHLLGWFIFADSKISKKNHGLIFVNWLTFREISPQYQQKAVGKKKYGFFLQIVKYKTLCKDSYLRICKKISKLSPNKNSSTMDDD